MTIVYPILLHQGSKLDPVLFDSYIAPLSRIAFEHNNTDEKYADNCESSLNTLSYGVPQGSKLVPVIFNSYVASLSIVARQHNITDEKYVDDEQLIFYNELLMKNIPIHRVRAQHRNLTRQNPKQPNLTQDLSKSKCKIVMLMLLYLSAALDTVDQ